MDGVKLFDNKDFGKVRVVINNGKPNFIVKDVCEILGIGNVTDATNRINSRWVSKIEVPHPQSNTKTIEVNAVTEPGLYKLVMRSNKPQAERFTDWIAEEVLPSIRKHGMYAEDEILDNPDLLIEVATKLKKEREERIRLEEENNKKDQVIGELQPKADYVDEILNSKGLVTITQIAKDYGVSGQEMNALLNDLGVQYKQSGQWLLYSKYHDKGYTKSKTFKYKDKYGVSKTKLHTKWCQKGRIFLYNLLKEEGVLPNTEKTEAEINREQIILVK